MFDIFQKISFSSAIVEIKLFCIKTNLIMKTPQHLTILQSYNTDKLFLEKHLILTITTLLTFHNEHVMKLKNSLSP